MNYFLKLVKYFFLGAFVALVFVIFYILIQLALIFA